MIEQEIENKIDKIYQERFQRLKDEKKIVELSIGG